MFSDIRVEQDKKDPTKFIFSWVESEDTIANILMMSELANEIQLSIWGHKLNRKFTEYEKNMVVHLTTYVEPKMLMGDAIEILDAGLVQSYINNNATRTLIDAWRKTERYAGLTLAEFMRGVQAD